MCYGNCWRGSRAQWAHSHKDREEHDFSRAEQTLQRIAALASEATGLLYEYTYSCIMNLTTRPVVWLGPTRRDIRAFPTAVRRDIGHALYTAQRGETDPAAKPLRGFSGGSVLEVVADHRGDTWRAVYTVRYAGAIYVLHAFQKKAKRGIATTKKDIDLINQRLAEAERMQRQRQN